MDGEARRRRILQLLQASQKPISGGELAEQCQVSRQVIVQDIALLRAACQGILSTNRGYLMAHAALECSRIFTVKHDSQAIEDELNLIVDYGGKVRDISVEHGIYGTLQAELSIGCRRDVETFLELLSQSSTPPLNELTDGIHSHLVSASTEQTLDLIEQQLIAKGYWVKSTKPSAKTENFSVDGREESVV